MKITDADYQALKTAVAPHIVPAQATSYQVQGLSPMRFRWDCLYESGALTSLWLYRYLNDENIDAALRRIMKDAGINWATK